MRCSGTHARYCSAQSVARIASRPEDHSAQAKIALEVDGSVRGKRRVITVRAGKVYGTVVLCWNINIYT